MEFKRKIQYYVSKIDYELSGWKKNYIISIRK